MDASTFSLELQELFYQRTRICLWLGIVFFSLFSLLDLIYCRDFFSLFLFYRISFVLILFGLLRLLTNAAFKKYTVACMFAAMLLGTLIISLMTVKLGGFHSGYYVGILLMIAGAFSALPMNVGQALCLGLGMYAIYAITVFLGSRPLNEQSFIYIVNNSFFFLTIVIVTTVQCMDELQMQRSASRARQSLHRMKKELWQYTGSLENLVKRRLALLEESDLKFRDLYNNIFDLVILLDAKGIIQMVNQQGAELLGLSPPELSGRSLKEFFLQEGQPQLIEQLLHRLKQGEKIRNIQLRMVTHHQKIMDVELSGDQVTIPQYGLQLQLIIRDITVTKEIERQVLQSNQLVDSSRQVAILGLAKLAECRDDDTGAHLLRIREYTRILAEELAQDEKLARILTPSYREELCLSSVLHDIGKVGIPDAILLKPGKLTADEFQIMTRHCELGSKALSHHNCHEAEQNFLKMGQEIARAHHEKWDGSGYPDGLKGPSIPLSARIVALADVYDALTSARCYKPPFSHNEALDIIIKDSGHRFDPAIVLAFLRQERDFIATAQRLTLPQENMH